VNSEFGAEKGGLCSRRVIVNVVTESRSVDNGQGNADAVFLELWDVVRDSN
jgi:hypothetical protein